MSATLNDLHTIFLLPEVKDEAKLEKEVQSRLDPQQVYIALVEVYNGVLIDYDDQLQHFFGRTEGDRLAALPEAALPEGVEGQAVFVYSQRRYVSRRDLHETERRQVYHNNLLVYTYWVMGWDVSQLV